MLIAISGSQGCGKTTTIQEFEDHGYVVIRRKTARSVLEEENLSLDEVNSSIKTKMWFQDKLLERKFIDECHSEHQLDTKEMVFTERTYADLFTYALVTLGPINDCSDWINDYYKRCCEYQTTYSKIFYLTGGHFDVVADGVRSTNTHYSQLVDSTMMEYHQKMKNDNLFVIGSKYRYNTISSYLQP